MHTAYTLHTASIAPHRSSSWPWYLIRTLHTSPCPEVDPLHRIAGSLCEMVRRRVSCQPELRCCWGFGGKSRAERHGDALILALAPHLGQLLAVHAAAGGEAGEEAGQVGEAAEAGAAGAAAGAAGAAGAAALQAGAEAGLQIEVRADHGADAETAVAAAKAEAGAGDAEKMDAAVTVDVGAGAGVTPAGVGSEDGDDDEGAPLSKRRRGRGGKVARQEVAAEGGDERRVHVAGGAEGAEEVKEEEESPEEESLALRCTKVARLVAARPEAAQPPPSDAACRRGCSAKVAPHAVPAAPPDPPAVPADEVESHVHSESRAEVAAATEALTVRVEQEECAPKPLPPSKPSVVALKQTGLRSFFGTPTV